MKFCKVEKIDASSIGYRRFLKRRASKGMRRAGKMDPENAPVKMKFRGWMS